MADLEQGIAVPQEVLGGDGGRHIGSRRLDEGCSLLGGDVLHAHPQARLALQQRLQNALDEDSLPIEEVDVGVGHLPMHQQRHVALRQHAACIMRTAGLRLGGELGWMGGMLQMTPMCGWKSMG